ncbi:major capsid protein [Bradyrhizobium sp. URHD0069]|uniref:major capsid protein n=1 Tax=Bradyrhizobium sp. URHD0069 TaxID=1380355 RepID=UPI0012DE38E7|nr:major capsid protein [Bradyrhizobium sp. URHD0069]
MVVFNDFVQQTITEVISQQVDLFNSASAGTITLTTKRNMGDFRQRSQFSEIANLIRRRDVYASGAVSPVALAMLQEASVKVATGTPPIAFNPSQFTWIQESPEVAGVVIGEQVAKGQFQDMLNTGLKAARAAFVNVGATAEYDVPSQGTLTLNALNRGAQKFGDSAQSIRAWAMHSTPLHDLYDAALTNTAQLFVFGDVQVREDGFGRRFVVTDSPSLYGAVSSPDVTDYYTLGLVENAIIVEDNGDFFSNLETSNGDENITRTWQGEWTYNLALKGYTWDTGNGGKSPTDTEIGTGSNWDKTATSIKNTAGVAVRSR